ncbi:MAG: CHAD domain-containing protein [Akkermansiaceae bacterium]|nr:CHAD domain-containing protein [Akkermansiaceae bacterium]
MTPFDEETAKFALSQLLRSCGTMEQLLEGLNDSKGSVAAEVHAIRKLGKSLRGGFALFRLEKTSAREIQAVGRLLADSRDAVSRLSTWEKMSFENDDSIHPPIAELLNQQVHSAAQRPPAEAVAWCIDRVIIAKKNLESLTAEETLAERLALGLKKLNNRIIKRCRDLNHGGEEEFHDARKALKAYIGALGFLPENSCALDPRMIELAERLGDENDLATLSSWLEQHGFTERFAPALWEEIGKSRSKLRKSAMRDAKKILTPPKEEP